MNNFLGYLFADVPSNMNNGIWYDLAQHPEISYNDISELKIVCTNEIIHHEIRKLLGYSDSILPSLRSDSKPTSSTCTGLAG